MQSIVTNGLLIVLGLVLATALGATVHFYSSHHGTVIVQAVTNGFEQRGVNYDAYVSVSAISKYDKPLFLKGIDIAGSWGCFGGGRRNGGIMSVIGPRGMWAGATVSVNGITDPIDLQMALNSNEIVLNPDKTLTMVIHIHTSCPQIHEASIVLHFVDSDGNKYMFTSNSFEIFS